MRAVERGKAAVERVVGAFRSSAASATPSPVRVLVATIVPLIAVFAVEFFYWGSTLRWSLLYPTVLVCAWFGGFESGVAATVISTALVWWYFVSPVHVILKPGIAKYMMAALFVLVGVLVSAVVRRLRRSSAELARNQRFLQAILDYSPDAIIIKDLDGRYILVNKAFEALTGVSAEAALQHTDDDVFAQSLAEELRAKDQVVRETQAPLHFEERLELNEGCVFLMSEFPLLDEAKRTFAIGAIATDISQRKHDEEALRESLEDLRAAQHVAHVGSWRWDFRTNRSTWSAELYEIFGIDPAQAPAPIVNPGMKLLTPDSLVRLTRAMDNLRAGGEPYELDLEFTRADGGRRWCAARGEARRDPTGRVIGINGTVADITHIKELERLRDEWTSVIAHDLRQPIGVISMASEFLPALHRDSSDQERAMLQHIQSATHALKRMVDDLLDMSLLEAHRLKLERKWIDLHDTVRDAVERHSRLIGARVKLELEGQPARVFADPMRVEQVLGNLLSNAVKYGDQKSAVEVRVNVGDGEVTIAVTNFGAGIAPEDLPRLFDRFMRSKMTRATGVRGLGLGLYISKAIVEAHGGRMWVDSVTGQHTTFYFGLPAKAARREAA